MASSTGPPWLAIASSCAVSRTLATASRSTTSKARSRLMSPSRGRCEFEFERGERADTEITLDVDDRRRQTRQLRVNIQTGAIEGVAESKALHSLSDLEIHRAEGALQGWYRGSHHTLAQAWIEARWHASDPALWLRQLWHLTGSGIFDAGGGLGAARRRLCGGNDPRRLGVRPRVASGRAARPQTKRARRFRRRRREARWRWRDESGAPRHPRRQQRRAAGARLHAAAAGALWCRSCRCAGRGYAAVPQVHLWRLVDAGVRRPRQG